MARELVLVFAGAMLLSAAMFALSGRLVPRTSAAALGACGLALIVLGAIAGDRSAPLRVSTVAAYGGGSVLLGIAAAMLHGYRDAGSVVLELGLMKRKNFLALPVAVCILGVVAVLTRYNPDPRLSGQHALIVGALFFFVAYGLWAALRFRRRCAITENGVLAGYRFLPWNEIKYYRWLDDRHLAIASENSLFGLARMVLDVPPRPHEQVEEMLAAKIEHHPNELSIFRDGD
jgi:hypothetical protein